MKYLKLLYVQVLIGIALGIMVGFYFPGFAPTAKLMSETFINLIKMVIAPVIFISIVLGISNSGDLKKVGRVGGKGLLYFEIVTTIAIIIGLLAANIIKPGAGVNMQAASANATAPATVAPMNWGEFLSHIVPTNIIDSFAKGDIIQILFFGILFAIGMKRMGAYNQSLISGFEKINKVLFNILHLVIKVSPIGAFGGMAFTIGKFGFASLKLLGLLLGTYYITSLVFIFVVLNLIARYYGFSLWKLLGYIKDEIVIVFGASSSEPVLPAIMEKLEKAGCDKSVVGLIIPAGYSFNLDGTSIYLSLSTIFLAQVFHVDMSLGQQLSVIGILLISSKGAAGVTGSGFLVLTSTLTALKIIPIEGLALLIGVDRFMSEGRALTNVIGNTVATIVIAKSEKAVDMNQYREVVEGRISQG
ncbi:MAG: C4-dicarboxylate transporter DctA [Chitinophagaceae bacterium]